MGYSGSRHKALSSWNAVVSNLLSSISSYSSTSVSLLEKVYTEGKGRHDIPLEEALVHIDKQLQAIDNAHKLLQSCQQKLLAHRNTSHTLVPINRLPWEILSRIVVLGTEGDKEMDSRLSDYYEAEQIHEWDNISELGEVDWIAGGQEEAYEGGSVYSICPYGEFVPFPRLFAQVCRKWRNVALSTATVWTTIDFSKNSDWVKELLTRSKGCPITVVMNLEGIPSSSLDEQCSDMFLQIDPHVSRVESLHLTTSHHLYIKEMLDRWAASWSRSNPFLRRLSIRAAKVPGLIELSNQDEVSKYRDFMKKVQELEIHGVSISWDDSIFQNLTSLKLTGIGLGRESPTTMQIYQFLSSSPNLERYVCTFYVLSMFNIWALLITIDVEFNLHLIHRRCYSSKPERISSTH
ncbi:hypothetical protein FRC02_005648 [Tulasnella sp. 418]|nr:hypothetical protein FRC02_005648 [Tulasnella sp. 418]